VKTIQVKNDPPELIFASNPSLLVLIDGSPQLREVPGTNLQRAINTRAILLFDAGKKTYYLRVKDWWLEAPKLEGPWTYARRLSDDMTKAEQYIATHAPDQAQQALDYTFKLGFNAVQPCAVAIGYVFSDSW